MQKNEQLSKQMSESKCALCNRQGGDQAICYEALHKVGGSKKCLSLRNYLMVPKQVFHPACKLVQQNKPESENSTKTMTNI